MLPRAVTPGDVRAFKEGGPVEWSQFGLVAACALLFALGAWRLPTSRALLIALATLAVIAMVREQDSLLLRMAAWSNWRAVAAPCAIVGGVLVWRSRVTLVSDVDWFVRTAPFAILWAALIIIGGVAQLVAHGDFLKTLISAEYNRDCKRVIEESTELCGYVVLLFGAVETVLAARRRESERPLAAAPK
jgi:hypothetical protein